MAMVTTEGEFVQVPLAQINWSHHIFMFPKLKDTALDYTELVRIKQITFSH
jgi:hypothetical protein